MMATVLSSVMEYTQVEENGKKQVKKLGMSPIQRDGMEFRHTESAHQNEKEATVNP